MIAAEPHPFTPPIDPWPEDYVVPDDVLDCDGDCIRGYDILGPGDGVPYSALCQVAYPDPSCTLHGIGRLDPGDPEE